MQTRSSDFWRIIKKKGERERDERGAAALTKPRPQKTTGYARTPTTDGVGYEKGRRTILKENGKTLLKSLGAKGEKRKRFLGGEDAFGANEIKKQRILWHNGRLKITPLGWG